MELANASEGRVCKTLKTLHAGGGAETHISTGAGSGRCRLLELPAELRIYIYELVLADITRFTPNIMVVYLGPGYTVTYTTRESIPQLITGAAALRVCAQMREETLPLYYRTLTLRCNLYGPPRPSWFHVFPQSMVQNFGQLKGIEISGYLHPNCLSSCDILLDGDLTQKQQQLVVHVFHVRKWMAEKVVDVVARVLSVRVAQAPLRVEDLAAVINALCSECRCWQ